MFFAPDDFFFFSVTLHVFCFAYNTTTQLLSVGQVEYCVLVILVRMRQTRTNDKLFMNESNTFVWVFSRK